MQDFLPYRVHRISSEKLVFQAIKTNYLSLPLPPPLTASKFKNQRALGTFTKKEPAHQMTPDKTSATTNKCFHNLNSYFSRSTFSIEALLCRGTMTDRRDMKKI
jgi:hypothetical protein